MAHDSTSKTPHAPLQDTDLIESGQALARLGTRPTREDFDVIVIGGGQAGLSVGHHLQKRGLRFVILDASERIGDSWRKRWDSLRLFTAARYDSLDGLAFPAPPDSFPTKDQMADYLELYARHFALPVRSSVRVERLTRRDGRYVVSVPGGELTASQVIVAMANYQRRKIPAFARELKSDIVQLHVSEYKNLEQLREGPVLLVGAGNSGAELAMETVRRHPTILSGRDTGHVPFRLDSFWGRFLLVRLLLRVLFHRVLTVRNALGRKFRAKVLHGGGPLIRQRAADLIAAGVERAGKTVGVRDGLPVLDDGRVLPVTNVLWCTGFERTLSFIELPIFDANGEPRHDGGVVVEQPGLYFVGQHFQYAMSSTMIHGVGRDAAMIVDVVARALRTGTRSAAPEAPCAALLDVRQG